MIGSSSSIGELEGQSNLSAGATIAIGLAVVVLIGVAVLAATEPWNGTVMGLRAIESLEMSRRS